MSRTLSFLAALFVLPAAAAAQTATPVQNGGPHAGTTPPTVTVTRVSGAIQVDGRLDDAAWASAQPVTSFTQVDPEEGQPASEATEARVLYDDEALYIGIRFSDRSRVSTRLGRRDMNLGDSDWAGVVIDSYHDHAT